MRKVLMLPGKEERLVNDSYGMRLLEQGKAIAAAQEAAPPNQKQEAQTTPKGKRH